MLVSAKRSCGNAGEPERGGRRRRIHRCLGAARVPETKQRDCDMDRYDLKGLFGLAVTGRRQTASGVAHHARPALVPCMLAIFVLGAGMAHGQTTTATSGQDYVSAINAANAHAPTTQIVINSPAGTTISLGGVTLPNSGLRQHLADRQQHSHFADFRRHDHRSGRPQFRSARPGARAGQHDGNRFRHSNRTGRRRRADSGQRQFLYGRHHRQRQ